MCQVPSGVHLLIRDQFYERLPAELTDKTSAIRSLAAARDAASLRLGHAKVETAPKLGAASQRNSAAQS